MATYDVEAVVRDRGIVEDLAKSVPNLPFTDCPLCHVDEPMNEKDHTPDCPWRRARDATR